MNNSTILTIKNAKFSAYYFYMNLNIQEDFQICISAPLRKFEIKLKPFWHMTKKSSKNLNILIMKRTFEVR